MKCACLAYKQKLSTSYITDPTPWAKELLPEENYYFQGVRPVFCHLKAHVVYKNLKIY